MFPNIDLTSLNEKQRQVLEMRYRYGWTLNQIARTLRITRQSAHEVLQRAHQRAGLPRLAMRRVRPPKPRIVRAVSLSSVFNY
jgi:transcriptional regulator